MPKKSKLVVHVALHVTKRMMIFVRSIKLKAGTVYPTELSFTGDRTLAAVFENDDAADDALEAVNQLTDYSAVFVTVTGKSRGTRYVGPFA